MRFKVFQLGEQIIDEDTGEVLDEGEGTEVGDRSGVILSKRPSTKIS